MSCSLLKVRWLFSKINSHNHIQNRPIRLIDASWAHPVVPGSVNSQNKLLYQEEHIPGAVHFDIDDCCDRNSRYPRTIPQADDFAYYVGVGCGMSNGHHAVIYDRGTNALPLMASFRVWWLFRLFNHEHVSILDGGLAAWKAEGLAVTDKLPVFKPAEFKAKLQKHLLTTHEDLVESLNTHDPMRIVDARGVSSWKRSQIPDSTPVPMSSLFQPNGEFIKPEEVASHFSSHGADLSDKKLVASCGSGVSACSLAFAAHIAGHPNVPVYDGSMTEFRDRCTDLVKQSE